MKGEFQKEYNKLNKAQKEAVEAIEGPVMVVAGPGTGKTQILALRIANILKKTDTGPENILALTFTNAGVISMRERLLGIIGDTAYRVNIFTFHAFCEYIIKEFSFYFEYLEGARVIGDLERVEILESIINNNRFEHLVSFHDEFAFLSKISSAILAIKKEGLSPNDFMDKLPLWEKELFMDEDLYYKKDYNEYKKGEIKPAEKEKINKKLQKARELGEIFSQYQEELKKRGLYDFSDMVLFVLDELKKNKELKSDLQEKYQYILTDEHQDTNEGQNTIIEILCDAPQLEKKPNIFTVGDEKQSIYKFQGASKEIFSKFRKLYKDIKIINLSENYRSTQNILDASLSLIRKGEEFIDIENLHSNTKDIKNEKVFVRGFSNYKFELLHLALDVKGKIDNGISPSEIAVLYRANKEVEDIKEVFDFYHIPYTIFSKEKILNDPIIKSLIYILKIIENPNDDHFFGKALFAKFLNFDVYDSVKILDRYKSQHREERKHIFSIIEDKKILEEIEVKDIKHFLEFAEKIKKLKKESLNNSFSDFFKMFLFDIGYIKYMLSASDSRIELTKIDKLFDEIKRQIKTKNEYSLSDFIFFVDSFNKYGLDIDSGNVEIVEGVSLMTAHSSKGREFEYVYIVSATRNSWEKRRGGNKISIPVYQHDGDVEDERRLFFVAMTRAKRGLSISFARTDNDGREHEESEFVREIDSSFISEEDMKDFERKSIDRLDTFLAVEQKSASLFEPGYIKSLFLKRGLNVSALNNYYKCPKKYLYKNLLQIPDAYSPALKFGNTIHKSLESFFSLSAKEKKILGREKLLLIFDREIYKTRLSEKDEKKFKEKGEKLLKEYYEEYADSWNYNVKTEFNPKKELELGSGDKLKLTGFIDKLEYNENGSVNIIDYKTGKAYSEKTKEEKEAYERQIIFYHLLLENYSDDLLIEKSILDFLGKNKKGNYEQYSLVVTKDHLENLKKEINKFAEDILSMRFLKKGCNKKDCEWCQFEK
ncbi:MAG: ATP-dependent DNA helicase [Candidatus Paceibacterota bacterium]|jgi:DNA helicase-2/ATP-dependent DNA helicase PcrA